MNLSGAEEACTILNVEKRRRHSQGSPHWPQDTRLRAPDFLLFATNTWSLLPVARAAPSLHIPRNVLRWICQVTTSMLALRCSTFPSASFSPIPISVAFPQRSGHRGVLGNLGTEVSGSCPNVSSNWKVPGILLPYSSRKFPLETMLGAQVGLITLWSSREVSSELPTE